MRRKNDLLFRASTTALALGGITLSAPPVWADNTAECNIGSFVNPANGLIISDLTSVECGINSNADGADTTAIGSDSTATADEATAVTNPIFQRQLINVADGTQDTDAVNLRQLNIVDDRVVALELAQQYLSVNSTDDPASANGEDAIALGEETSAFHIQHRRYRQFAEVGSRSDWSVFDHFDSDRGSWP